MPATLSKSAMMVPMPMVSPSATRIFRMPSASAGSSNVALSDSNSAITSSRFTASPATGYNKIHIKEQKELVARAFDKPKEAVADNNIEATAEIAKKQD